MRFNPFVTALAVTTLAASALSAQQRGRVGAPPEGGPPRGGPIGRPVMGPAGMDAASMLLAQTAELKLTDQQVTRLAAIARRVGDRRAATMAGLDSLRAARMRAAGTPGGTAGTGRMPAPADREMLVRMREQSHADLRDALGVLTPDQLATSWEVMAGGGRRGRMMGRGMQMGGMRERQDRSGQPEPNPSGFRRNGVEPRPASRPPA